MLTGTATAANQVIGLTSLNNIDNSTTSIDNEVQSLNVKLTAKTVTPNIIRATGAGSIPAGAYSFSVANIGSADGILLGQTIKPSEIINFDAGSLNNVYGDVVYDATGTELLITYNS